MHPALHLNGMAGIVQHTDIGNTNFNYGLPIHQVFFPIVYFRIKNEKLFLFEKHLSNISENIQQQNW